MIGPVRKLLRNERGAAIIEFAIAIPVLVLFIWGIFQIGLLFQAYAGMQHALGEAARFAVIHPTPSDDELRARMAGRKFGTGNGSLGTLQITTAANNEYKTLSLSYQQPLDFLFFQGPSVTLTQSKVVYLA